MRSGSIIENSSNIMLGIETATRGGSVALARGAGVLAAVEGDPAGTASTQLLVQIRDLLAANDLTLAAVDRIAVAIGPGSFTGLRIGLATVKGLAATLGCAVDAVPTLHAVAISANAQGPVMALMPAGRGEVFAQEFEITDDVPIMELSRPDHLPLIELLKQKSNVARLTWAAAAGLDLSEAVDEFARDGRDWRVAKTVVNLATEVVRVARTGSWETTPEALTAMYVRLSDAELKLRCQP